MGDGTHNWEFTAQRVHEMADEFRRQDAEASGAPAHIQEMRNPHPMQHVIDAESVRVLRATGVASGLMAPNVTDDEWDALVDACRQSEYAPELFQLLERIGPLFEKVVE